MIADDEQEEKEGARGQEARLYKNGGKNEFEINAENVDLRFQLSKVTSELESIKLEHVELEKYNTIVKGELVQTKQ